MNALLDYHASSPPEELTIGDLGERTGVSPATLRMWEQRHGFPVPRRLQSGHRRYDRTHVEAVSEVVRRRDGGVRLDVAIAQVIAESQSRPAAPSVFATTRRLHPELAVHRLRKPTLLALSWAIEDEVSSRAERAHVFGAFQLGGNFEKAAPRWRSFAPLTASTFAFADFPGPGVHEAPGQPVCVPLAPDAPMRREWAVICDSPGLSAALTAWEMPGQDGVRERDRVFESVWTVQPIAVRDAARVCAGVASDAGSTQAVSVAAELADPPLRSPVDLLGATELFNRVLSYVDDPSSRR